MAIEAAEACGGQRLVDGRPVPDPGIAFRDRAGVAGQADHEAVADQVGVAGAAAVVHQAHDRPHAKLAKTRQPGVRPAPVARLRIVRRDAFPQHRIADRLEPESGEQLQVGWPVVVAGAAGLVAEPAPDPLHRAFVPAPQFQYRRLPQAVYGPRAPVPPVPGPASARSRQCQVAPAPGRAAEGVARLAPDLVSSHVRAFLQARPTCCD